MSNLKATLTAGTLATLLLMFATVPLPSLKGNPTGFVLILDLWYQAKANDMVSWNLRLSENTIDQLKKEKVIKNREWYYQIHRSLKPKRFEYPNDEEYLYYLQKWESEEKEKREELDKLKEEAIGLEEAYHRIAADNPAALNTVLFE